MPLREFGCEPCRVINERYSPMVDPAQVPIPKCAICGLDMQMLFSVPNIDTSSTFKAFDYKCPETNKVIRIDNLHKLRAVEHASLESGRNIRFDAYSAEPSNPDAIDGFGLEYWDGKPTSTTGKTFGMPTM